eukprot:365460-Chlamydomonas_euryale.AAC.3
MSLERSVDLCGGCAAHSFVEQRTNSLQSAGQGLCSHAHMAACGVLSSLSSCASLVEDMRMSSHLQHVAMAVHTPSSYTYVHAMDKWIYGMPTDQNKWSSQSLAAGDCKKRHSR